MPKKIVPGAVSSLLSPRSAKPAKESFTKGALPKDRDTYLKTITGSRLKPDSTLTRQQLNAPAERFYQAYETTHHTLNEKTFPLLFDMWVGQADWLAAKADVRKSGRRDNIAAAEENTRRALLDAMAEKPGMLAAYAKDNPVDAARFAAANANDFAVPVLGPELVFALSCGPTPDKALANDIQRLQQGIQIDWPLNAVTAFLNTVAPEMFDESHPFLELDNSILQTAYERISGDVLEGRATPLDKITAMMQHPVTRAGVCCAAINAYSPQQAELCQVFFQKDGLADKGLNEGLQKLLEGDDPEKIRSAEFLVYRVLQGHLNIADPLMKPLQELFLNAVANVQARHQDGAISRDYDTMASTFMAFSREDKRAVLQSLADSAGIAPEAWSGIVSAFAGFALGAGNFGDLARKSGTWHQGTANAPPTPLWQEDKPLNFGA